MLTLTTKRLCRDGLVERTVYPTTPPQTDYRLTPMGKSLTDMVVALADWSRDHKNTIAAARSSWDQDLELSWPAYSAQGFAGAPIRGEPDGVKKAVRLQTGVEVWDVA